MADVKKIKLPDNSVYNIKDYRIPGVDTVPTSGSGNVITSGGIYAANYAGSDSNGGPALKTYGIPYGAVDSTSTSTVMTATVDNFPTELTDGVCAYIRNDIISSASGWTLNVNGTGAKPVYASNADATRVTTLFSAASTFLFVYNSTRVSGGCWDMYYGYNANDNTIGYNLRTNGTIAPTKSKFYRYRILFTSPDGQYLIPSNTSTSTNATAIRSVNQDKIDPFGPIYYYNSTTAIEANASVGASYLWLQYSAIYLGYSFNRTSTALTLTAKHPIYIKCAPQTDGSAIIDDGTPFVQTLPSTEDGKIYIFLGYAESATTAILYYYHPIYYYKDNAIRLWTNAADTRITVDTELSLQSDNPISNAAVTQVIFDNEQVTAAALNDLRSDISTIDKVTASSLNDLNDRMLEAEDTLSEMDEYISDLGEVASTALNDLNDRTLALENDTAIAKQKVIVGDSMLTITGDRHDDRPTLTDYINKNCPNPKEGDIFVLYDPDKKELWQVVNENFTIEMDNAQEQGWSEASPKFVQYEGNSSYIDYNYGTYIEIESDTAGDYRFYPEPYSGMSTTESVLECILTEDDLDEDGKYRYKGNVWISESLYLYYSGSVPNIKIYHVAPQSEEGELEYYHGSWVPRQSIIKYRNLYFTQDEIYESDTSFPSNTAILKKLENYIYLKSEINYDSKKDRPVTFEYIPDMGSAEVYLLRKLNSGTTSGSWTLQTSTDGSTWTTVTLDTHSVLLGTVSSSTPRLYVKSDNLGSNGNGHCQFHMSAPCYVYGDLISLVGGHVYSNSEDKTGDISDTIYNQSIYTFYELFMGEVNLFSHPYDRLYLVTKRVAGSGYQSMFSGCTNMTVSPIVYASSYSSYSFSTMFSGCKNMKILITNAKARIGNTYYPWLPDGFCSGNDIYHAFLSDASYYKNYRRSYWWIYLDQLEKYHPLICYTAEVKNDDLLEDIKAKMPQSGRQLIPYRIHNLGVLTYNVSIYPADSNGDPRVPHYFVMFDTGSTAYSVSWADWRPTLIWPEGNPPTLKPNHHYEFSILNNVVAWMEV